MSARPSRPSRNPPQPAAEWGCRRPPEIRADLGPANIAGHFGGIRCLRYRTALKVVRVEPGSPAEKAGLEPGDVIVAANGAAITGPEQLASAVRKSGAALELTVRDSLLGATRRCKSSWADQHPQSRCRRNLPFRALVRRVRPGEP